jgi:putative restriction endonuclease
MTRDSVLHRFDKLNVWSRGDRRAPHKPLLVLYALGRWSRGEAAYIPFKQVDADLTGLLKEFGPPRHSYHPEYPFWRLQNDGVWLVHAAGPLTPRQGNTDPKKSDLLATNAAGGLTPEELERVPRSGKLMGRNSRESAKPYRRRATYAMASLDGVPDSSD